MRASANSVFRSGVNEDEQKLPVTREECKRRLQLRREVRRHREQSHRAEETAEEKAHSLLVQNQGNCQRRENEGTEHRAQRLQVQNVANAATEKMSRWVPAREDQTLWVLLEQAKRQEERTGDAKFICTVQVHPECACILAHPCQLEEVQPFCTNQKELTIFGADPTFNIFTKNMSYHHHMPQLKTGASWDWRKPCFHWPSTDASAQGSSHISQLCPCLGSENPNLECILACETDGEKPLYRFRRVLKYAVFLLCSLHFKQNKEG